MSSLDQIESAILRLPPDEFERLSEWFLQRLNKEQFGITSSPGVCGGKACIKGTRIPVWVLERARQLGATDVQLLEMYPELGREDLRNAWRYVDSYKEEVERQIRENEDFK
jgi:uncharacterized protein (DUF433 family)